jgi:hypothetical protein
VLVQRVQGRDGPGDQDARVRVVAVQESACGGGVGDLCADGRAGGGGSGAGVVRRTATTGRPLPARAVGDSVPSPRLAPTTIVVPSDKIADPDGFVVEFAQEIPRARAVALVEAGFA